MKLIICLSILFTVALQAEKSGLDFVRVKGDGKVKTFEISTTEVSNEQYVRFLNAAYKKGYIKYDPDATGPSTIMLNRPMASNTEGKQTNLLSPKKELSFSQGQKNRGKMSNHQRRIPPKSEMVYDKDGNPMIWIGGTRVIKDHNRNGVYELEEMENPLNRSWIGFSKKYKRFYVVDPAKVNWNQYFDKTKYPNAVDSINDWAELNPRKTGFYGDGDKDKKLPTREEVKTWPVNYIRYPGAAAFAKFYGYDVPTKAQWQYAGKGGKDFVHSTSDGTADRGVAWINIVGPPTIFKGHPQPVKSKKANPYGIYNLGGNVWEWVQDWCKVSQVFFAEKKDSDFYIDPNLSYEEAGRKTLKGILGGSFTFFTRTMRNDWNHAAMPFAGNDHFGVRVVRNPK